MTDEELRNLADGQRMTDEELRNLTDEAFWLTVLAAAHRSLGGRPVPEADLERLVQQAHSARIRWTVWLLALQGELDVFVREGEPEAVFRDPRYRQ
jgi:hypothetical protein